MSCKGARRIPLVACTWFLEAFPFVEWPFVVEKSFPFSNLFLVEQLERKEEEVDNDANVC